MAYLTAAEVRAKSSTVDGDGRFTDAVIDALVAEFEEIAEDYLGYASDTRTATAEQHRATEAGRVVLLNRYISAPSAITVDGTAASAGQIATLDVLTRQGVLEDGWWPRGALLAVTYTYGKSAPSDILERATAEYVRAAGLEMLSKKPRNTISYQDDSGYTFRESTPDKMMGRPTGFILVDRLLNSAIETPFQVA